MTKAHELRLAKRMARLGTETAFEVLVKARALEAKGRDIVHLEIGEPDFDTPGNIIEAANDALHNGFTHYGPSAGLPKLRETIAQYVSETRRVNATPEEVVVVPGGKTIIFFTILALVEEGDDRLATGNNDHFFGCCVYPARLAHVLSDGLAQFRQPGRRSVVSEAVVQRVVRRFNDVARGVEIGFPDLEMNNIAALRLQRSRLH